jgi:hypothetical protein
MIHATIQASPLFRRTKAVQTVFRLATQQPAVFLQVAEQPTADNLGFRFRSILYYAPLQQHTGSTARKQSHGKPLFSPQAMPERSLFKALRKDLNQIIAFAILGSLLRCSVEVNNNMHHHRSK